MPMRRRSSPSRPSQARASLPSAANRWVELSAGPPGAWTALPACGSHRGSRPGTNEVPLTNECAVAIPRAQGGPGAASPLLAYCKRPGNALLRCVSLVFRSYSAYIPLLLLDRARTHLLPPRSSSRLPAFAVIPESAVKPFRRGDQFNVTVRRRYCLMKQKAAELAAAMV